MNVAEIVGRTLVWEQAVAVLAFCFGVLAFLIVLVWGDAARILGYADIQPVSLVEAGMWFVRGLLAVSMVGTLVNLLRGLVLLVLCVVRRGQRSP